MENDYEARIHVNLHDINATSCLKTNLNAHKWIRNGNFVV